MKSHIDTSIVEIDPANVTLSQARESAAIIIESFSDSESHQAMWGPDYTFLEYPIPPEREAKYNALLTVNSWSTWLNMRSENSRCFSAVQGGKPIGFCMWRMPKSEHTDDASWWNKLKDYFIGLWIKVLNFWYFGSGFNPTVTPMEIKTNSQEFRMKHSFVHDDPEKRRAELSTMSEDELAEALFLEEDYYWCSLLGIKSGYQGQGIGGLLFRESIKRLRTRDTSMNGTIMPSRLGLVATIRGRPLYEKEGFKIFKTVTHEVKGQKIVVYPMQKILNKN